MKKISLKLKGLITIMAVVIAALGLSVAVYAETVKPAKVTGLKQTDASTSNVKVEWDSQVTSPKYEIHLSEDGKTFVKVDDAYSNSYTVYNQSAGKTFYVKVIAYDGYGDDKVYADQSSDVLKVSTLAEEVTDLKQTSATTSSVTLTWKASKGATGYYVFFNQGSSRKQVAKVTKNTVTVKNAKQSDNYYIQVCPYTATSSGEFADTDAYSGTRISGYDLRIKPSKISTKDFWVANYWSSLNEINLKWNPATMIDGYQVQAYTSKGKKVCSKFTTSTSMYIENVKKNSFYKVRLRGYSVINGKKVYGSWSSYNYFAHQPEVDLKAGKKTLTASWKKVAGATSYTVYVSTKQKSGYKKVTTTKKASYKITKYGKKKLSSKKKYYVYVVANTKVGKTTYKSNADYCWYLKTK